MTDPTPNSEANAAVSPVILSANKVKELTELMREASAILCEIPEASAPKNMRSPLPDELDGFAHMLSQAANIEKLQGPEIEGIRAHQQDGGFWGRTAARQAKKIDELQANSVIQDLSVHPECVWVHNSRHKLHICQGPDHIERMKNIGADVFELRDAYKMNLSPDVIDQVCKQVFYGYADPQRRENWIRGFKMVAIAHAKSSAEQAIAYLRLQSDEPVSIELGDGIDIEVRPITEDQRITVGREGLGYTTVNYTTEGLIVDVYSADQSINGPCSTLALDRADLDDPEMQEVNQSDMFRPSGG
jgi:hypothetical protein